MVEKINIENMHSYRIDVSETGDEYQHARWEDPIPLANHIYEGSCVLDGNIIKTIILRNNIAIKDFEKSYKNEDAAKIAFKKLNIVKIIRKMMEQRTEILFEQWKNSVKSIVGSDSVISTTTKESTKKQRMSTTVFLKFTAIATVEDVDRVKARLNHPLETRGAKTNIL